MNGKKIPKAKLKTYIKQIVELENKFGKYNQKGENEIYLKDTGYLINKNDFNNFKLKLNYSQLKLYIYDESKFNAKLSELYGNTKEIAFIPCEQKIFNSSKDLIANLNKYNEYAIINLFVWKIINNGKYNENEGKINFEIKDNKIVLSFRNGVNVYFKYNSNIISYNNLLSSLSGDKNKMILQIKDHKDNKNNGNNSPKKLLLNLNKANEENLINKLYLSMIDFYNYEQIIMNQLKLNENSNNEIMEGYFL